MNIYGIFFKVSGKFSESFREINYIASVMDVCGGHACTAHFISFDIFCNFFGIKTSLAYRKRLGY